MSDQLRVALAGMSHRERRAMREQAEQAAVKWEPFLPRVAAVWTAYAALVGEVDELANARERAAS